ncbi:MAG: type I-E CRISPR-associated endonuclease Cas1e [Clostridiales bacterium]|nr:type I-E CRISPR-associated endonuclease Cas1e [Clostridiales bacterium]
MSDIPGMVHPDLQSLPKIADRMTFLYLERCKLKREDSAIIVIDDQGSVFVPAAAISVLLLGPGTEITHRAMELIGDAGVTVIWVGEHGVRFYAGGRPLTHRASLLQKQAELVSNQKAHLEVVRNMYAMRFPNEDVSTLTMQQLRGREGARVRAAYRKAAKEYNIEWDGRDYDPENFESGTPVNQALTAGNVCLYGLAHAVIFALGCSAGLGFVHVGHENSFVYDIADLYKAEIVIPLAFEVAAQDPPDLPSVMRRRVRDRMVEANLLERMVKDIKYLLKESQEAQDTQDAQDALYLWDNARDVLPGGRSY